MAIISRFANALEMPEKVWYTDSADTDNKLKYRGYYYDDQLQMYYLQTRYYDSAIGRFINADGYVSTGQGVLENNMFAYCGNNPVMRVDPTGEGVDITSTHNRNYCRCSGNSD